MGIGAQVALFRRAVPLLFCLPFGGDFLASFVLSVCRFIRLHSTTKPAQASALPACIFPPHTHTTRVNRGRCTCSVQWLRRRHARRTFRFFPACTSPWPSVELSGTVDMPQVAMVRRQSLPAPCCLLPLRTRCLRSGMREPWAVRPQNPHLLHLVPPPRRHRCEPTCLP